jgi:hypothetical protein
MAREAVDVFKGEESTEPKDREGILVRKDQGYSKQGDSSRSVDDQPSGGFILKVKGTRNQRWFPPSLRRRP